MQGAAWGLLGTLGMLVISTTWDNKQAIAVLDSKVVEAKELGEKMDRINDEVSGISSRLSMVRGDIADMQAEQHRLWVATEKGDHIARCDDRYRSLVDREECYATFTPPVAGL